MANTLGLTTVLLGNLSPICKTIQVFVFKRCEDKPVCHLGLLLCPFSVHMLNAISSILFNSFFHYIGVILFPRQTVISLPLFPGWGRAGPKLHLDL